MLIQVLKSKIHKAPVTETLLEYEGSITIDENYMKAANIHQYEKVLISNESTGDRFETYVIKGKKGSKTIMLNGAAARLGYPGDLITILSFCSIEEKDVASHKPTILVLSKQNA